MRFTALAPVALILAVACSDGDAPLDTADGRLITASGSVFAAAGTVPANARFIVASGGQRTSTTIASNGTFAIQARAAADDVDLIVEAAGMHPSLVRLRGDQAVPPLAFVLVPRRWTIRGGTYDGTTVDISLDAAFRPPCVTPGDTNCDSFYPSAWTGAPRLWPRAAFPIPVAFDHARAHEIVTNVDSTEFWRVLDRMSADFGTALFRPAHVNEITLGAQDRPQQAIVVRVDTTLSGFSAWTNWWWNASGEMNSAVVRPRRASFVRYSSLMTHELLHTQGFKHSCAWTTVMGGYGCGSSTGLSREDVAYAQLASQVELVQRQSGAGLGLAAARDGERVVTLGLPLIDPPTRTLNSLRADSIGDMHGDHAHARFSVFSRR
jgi:hypothetical protein